MITVAGALLIGFGVLAFALVLFRLAWQYTGSDDVEAHLADPDVFADQERDPRAALGQHLSEQDAGAPGTRDHEQRGAPDRKASVEVGDRARGSAELTA